MSPTIYLTNAATVNVVRRGKGSEVMRASVGPGRVWTIMAKPRVGYGEAGEGSVAALAPFASDLEAVKAGRMSEAEYRDRCEREFNRALLEGRLRPGPITTGGLGFLVARLAGNLMPPKIEPVADGDTLICACSRMAASEGKCHRAWAAAALAQAGWDAVLDGRPLNPDAAPATDAAPPGDPSPTLL